jgi:hypothetical protein
MENSSIFVALVAIGITVVLNLILAAFSYGKLNQSVSDLCRRVEKLEEKVA